MTNDELAAERFELGEGGNCDCDFCHQDVPEGEWFWRRTSYEYVEGDYACRACATKRIRNDRAFIDTFDAQEYARIAGIEL